jgi:TonB family protein
MLGNMYDQGQGVSRSTIEANKWWYKAALHGNADALQKLANMDCHKLFPQGKGAIPGINCLNIGGNNYDLLGKTDHVGTATSPTPVAGEKAEWPTYSNQVGDILWRNRNYPADAANRREQGTVIVTFTLDRSGRLTERHVSKSSGSMALDKAALDLVDRSQPFPPFPPDFSQTELTMTLPLRFVLPAR